jgi:hypothetical protein
MRSIVLLMLSLIITSGIDGQQSTALNRKEIRANKKALREAAVDSIIQSGSFTIDVQTALPRGWQAIQLSSLYQITIKGDTIDTHLPYYGRTYTLAFPVSDGGIKLHAPMNEYRSRCNGGYKWHGAMLDMNTLLLTTVGKSAAIVWVLLLSIPSVFLKE